MDWKLEAVVVPVSDVDRAKGFYVDRLGFRLDVDHDTGPEFRVVQVTPPGSACSLTFGVNVGAGEPGTLRGVHLVVDDAEAAAAQLTASGVEHSGPQHFEDGRMVAGLDPERRRFRSYVFFSDPDGNSFAVQEVPPGSRAE